jgi:hypothetical protein
MNTTFTVVEIGEIEAEDLLKNCQNVNDLIRIDFPNIDHDIRRLNKICYLLLERLIVAEETIKKLQRSK